MKTSGEQLVCLSLFLFEQNIFGLWVFFQSMPMTDSTILATPSWTWWNWASYMKAGDVTILLVSSMHTCKINRKCLLKTKLPMKRHLIKGDNLKKRSIILSAYQQTFGPSWPVTCQGFNGFTLKIGTYFIIFHFFDLKKYQGFTIPHYAKV